MESGTHPLVPLLVSYQESFHERVGLIRVNITKSEKRSDVVGWIKDAYYYAELSYQTSLRIIHTGGTLYRLNQAKEIIKTDLTAKDLIELYYERIGQVSQLEKRLQSLIGEAVPIVAGTLRVHENKGKGLIDDRHVLAKHVPKLVQDLHQRLQQEPDKDIVSGFLTEDIANSALSRTIVRNENAIQIWLRGTSRKQEFTTDFGSEAIGLVLRRNVRAAFSGHRVTIVLVRDANSPVGYWIKTSKIDS